MFEDDQARQDDPDRGETIVAALKGLADTDHAALQEPD